jgi:alpha-L-arabinofuranosidase
MFGQSSGNYYYGDCVSIDGADNHQEQSVVLNTKTRELFVKVCNASADSKQAKLNLSRFKSMKAVGTMTTLKGQPEDENNYDAQPIAPQTEEVKMKKKMTLDIAPYSFTMIKVNL